MNKKELLKILEKIQVYRQSFIINDDVINEWFRVLEPYSYEDIDHELDEFFEDETNKGRYPDPKIVSKYVKTIEDKENFQRQSTLKIRCRLCGKGIDITTFDKHFDRCSSIEFICRNYEKYYNKKIDKNKLWKLSNVDFGIRYWKFCEELSDIKGMPDNFKRSLQNAITTHYGNEPINSFQVIISKVGDNIE